MTGLLYDGQIEKPLEKALEIGARQVAVRGDLVTSRLLKEARACDLQVVCWTVNQPAHLLVFGYRVQREAAHIALIVFFQIANQCLPRLVAELLAPVVL